MPVDEDTIEIVKPKQKAKVEKPKLWACKLYNDDFTPIEFVVGVLTEVFKLGLQEAVQITMTVHEQGSAVVGAYTKDIAETKAMQVMDLAKSQQHPLKVEAVPA